MLDSGLQAVYPLEHCGGCCRYMVIYSWTTKLRMIYIIIIGILGHVNSCSNLSETELYLFTKCTCMRSACL